MRPSMHSRRTTRWCCDNALTGLTLEESLTAAGKANTAGNEIILVRFALAVSVRPAAKIANLEKQTFRNVWFEGLEQAARLLERPRRGLVGLTICNRKNQGPHHSKTKPPIENGPSDMVTSSCRRFCLSG